MSYPVLPRLIPALALRDAWSLRPSDPLRRTEMDDGEIAVERRVSRITGRQTLTWEMTGAQLDLLIAFWAEELNAGESWFMAPMVEGTRTVERLVRFGGGDVPWQAASPAGGKFRFSFEAELRELPRLSPAERMAMEAFVASPTGIAALADALEPIVDALKELPTWR